MLASLSSLVVVSVFGPASAELVRDAAGVGIHDAQRTAPHRSVPEPRPRRLQTFITGSDFTLEEAVAILDQHNDFRRVSANGQLQTDAGAFHPAASNMNYLFWDNALAEVAQNYAEECIWAHNENVNLEFTEIFEQASFEYDGEYGWNGEVGENLYFFDGGGTVQDIALEGLGLWWEEGLYYTWSPFDPNEDNCDLTEVSTCAHFTQMAWARTRYVGCGYHMCSTLTDPVTQARYTDALYLVCNYYQAGNFADELPYEEGAACATCDADRDFCDESLCGGCPAAFWQYCQDFDNGVNDLCDQFTGQCLADCDLTNEATNVFCQACRTSCDTCANSNGGTLLDSPSTCTNGLVDYVAAPEPTASPSDSPIMSPSPQPTDSPSRGPTDSPSNMPTDSPSRSPSDSPTDSPSPGPTAMPTPLPVVDVTPEPTVDPRWEDCSEEERDWVFVVESTTLVTAAEDADQKEFVLNLIGNAYGEDLRVGLIRYDNNAFNPFGLEDFDDENFANFAEFAAFYDTEFISLANSAVPDLSEALFRAEDFMDDESSATADRKVVVVLGHHDAFEVGVCDFAADLIALNVEVIIVAVHGNSELIDFVSCLVQDDSTDLFEADLYDDLADEDLIIDVTDRLCDDRPVVDAPTMSPSNMPTMSPSNVPTETPPTARFQYGLEALRITRNFNLELEHDHTTDVLSLCLTGDAGDLWYGVGLGGDYSLLGEALHNGWAFISQDDECADGTCQYETILEPGEIPEPLAGGSDFECTVWTAMDDQDDLIRYVHCEHENWSSNDHGLTLANGDNELIWAVGDVAGNGDLEQHGTATADAGDDEIDMDEFATSQAILCQVPEPSPAPTPRPTSPPVTVVEGVCCAGQRESYDEGCGTHYDTEEDCVYDRRCRWLDDCVPATPAPVVTGGACCSAYRDDQPNLVSRCFTQGDRPGDSGAKKCMEDFRCYWTCGCCRSARSQFDVSAAHVVDSCEDKYNEDDCTAVGRKCSWYDTCPID